MSEKVVIMKATLRENSSSGTDATIMLCCNNQALKKNVPHRNSKSKVYFFDFIMTHEDSWDR